MTVITPSAAARRKEKNFVIDENLSLVGYVIAVKLNELKIPVEEELDFTSFHINKEPLCTEDIIIENIQ